MNNEPHTVAHTRVMSNGKIDTLLSSRITHIRVKLGNRSEVIEKCGVFFWTWRQRQQIDLGVNVEVTCVAVVK